MVLYGAPRRHATVKANFKLVRDGNTYEGDAGAVRYLTELHAAQAATWKRSDGVDVPVLTADEFQRLVQRYAALAATAMTDTEDGSSGVVRTPLLVAAPGEALKAGTVTFLSSAVVHHAPPCGQRRAHERASHLPSKQDGRQSRSTAGGDDAGAVVGDCA